MQIVSIGDNLHEWIDCVGVNDTLTLVGHFVSSPREREKREEETKERNMGRKRNGNESEETEEIRTVIIYPYLLQG